MSDRCERAGFCTAPRLRPLSRPSRFGRGGAVWRRPGTLRSANYYDRSSQAILGVLEPQQNGNSTPWGGSCPHLPNNPELMDGTYPMNRKRQRYRIREHDIAVQNCLTRKCILRDFASEFKDSQFNRDP